MTPSGQDLRDPETKDDRHRNLDELETVQEALRSTAGPRAAQLSFRLQPFDMKDSS